ncbi:hypothetical protein LXA43DRAFT_913818, partial [Ganoderma leucocontextum]
MSPQLLPWEGLERIIRHSRDYPKTLHNFSLTCCELRPRSSLVANVVFTSRDPIFDFCDFLQAKPHLKPLVRSIAVNPNDFAPIPILNVNVLPNLSDLTFAPAKAGSDDPDLQRLPTVLNRSTLTCCQRLGTHIQTPHLSQLSFPTYLAFARLLLAFTNITHLVC